MGAGGINPLPHAFHGSPQHFLAMDEEEEKEKEEKEEENERKEEEEEK